GAPVLPDLPSRLYSHFLLSSHPHPPHLHSFPTRRSSDLGGSDEEKFDHPTQKPIELMRKPIVNHTRRGELVYEPFLGSGTTQARSEEHTSELQSQSNLVCRLLLEKKKQTKNSRYGVWRMR